MEVTCTVIRNMTRKLYVDVHSGHYVS